MCTVHVRSLNRLQLAISENIRHQNRSLFYWLTVIFNSVDKDRIREVGPDLACAEWLLRNGAFVKWKGFPELVADYNTLPSKGNGYRIESVEANDAGISHEGFPHFEGCKYIKEIKLENCRYVTNKAMPLLSILQDSLTNLELINCKSIDDEGLLNLTVLKNLKKLKLQGLVYIRDKDSIQKKLTEALPNCQIDFKSISSRKQKNGNVKYAT
ncbi:ATP synthase subunit s, mitochondrial-like isoform X2 [Calliopsis andreniformis]|uniref:ATP synthase subunit s, mitochondrial-like isoform X2 n=1 Tax=Calliopsis andreniformis TaxID=337506 RepID=UPI003FCC5137